VTSSSRTLDGVGGQVDLALEPVAFDLALEPVLDRGLLEAADLGPTPAPWCAGR
jgi:hypothetical protein